jgi:hypothetical protein
VYLAGNHQIEGTGCSASISFKTYYETEEVRVCCKSRSRCGRERVRALTGFFFCVFKIVRSTHMKLASRISLSREEVAAPRSNKRRLARRDVVPMLRMVATAPRSLLRRPLHQPRFLDLKNRVLTRSHLNFRTHHNPNKRLTPSYSLTTPRRHSRP